VYNRLVVLRNRCANAFSQIDVQLKRRFELLPNLVESARAYLEHERSTLESVVKARSLAAGLLEAARAAKSKVPAVGELSRADQAVAGLTGRLIAAAEQYPALKADRTIQTLTEDLKSTENRVGYARQAYNDAVMEYNTTLESFPSLVFGPAFGFGPADLWWAGPESRVVPKAGPARAEAPAAAKK
ncbi:MAG: LemA family protein, partial [Deltaproteobacteria bacterium]|nr:LemA family protein [Deltaproteobacteria bacterium]